MATPTSFRRLVRTPRRAPGHERRAASPNAPQIGGAARVQLARHARHAAAVGEDRLGFHAARLEARRATGSLDAPAGFAAVDAARARAARHRHAARCGASPSASRTSPPEQVRDEVAAGRMVIPANKVHLGYQLDPMAHRPREPRPRSTPTWAPRRSRRGTDEEVEKLQLGRDVGRRHGDGPLDRRRPRRVPRGDHPEQHACRSAPCRSTR